jgi:hypothetical protein
MFILDSLTSHIHPVLYDLTVRCSHYCIFIRIYARSYFARNNLFMCAEKNLFKAEFAHMLSCHILLLLIWTPKYLQERKNYKKKDWQEYIVLKSYNMLFKDNWIFVSIDINSQSINRMKYDKRSFFSSWMFFTSNDLNISNFTRDTGLI